VAGIYLGFRWTRGMASHQTVDTARAPAALLQRGRGGWTVGGLGLRRVPGRGAAVSLVSGSW